MPSRAFGLALAGFAALGAAVLGAYVYERVQRAHAPAAAALPVVPATEPAVVPTDRPTFTLADLAGRRHSITEWDGKGLLINFWATWCAPCRHEIPLLNRIQREYASKGIQVVGIAVDVPKDVQAYVAEVPLDYPLLVGEQDGIDVAQSFGINALAFPITAFSDAHGHLLSVHLGELHEPTARAILAALEGLDAGTLTPAAARAAVEAAEAAAPRPGSGAGG